MTDRLAEIEREAKRRRKQGSEVGYQWRDLGDAETALDQALAIARHYRDEAHIRTVERDIAREDLLLLRAEVKWWEREHGCCAGKSLSVLENTQRYEAYRDRS